MCELMTKVVLSVECAPYWQWQECKQALIGQDKKIEQFWSQFGAIKV